MELNNTASAESNMRKDYWENSTNNKAIFYTFAIFFAETSVICGINFDRSVIYTIAAVIAAALSCLFFYFGCKLKTDSMRKEIVEILRSNIELNRNGLEKIDMIDEKLRTNGENIIAISDILISLEDLDKNNAGNVDILKSGVQEIINIASSIDKSGDSVKREITSAISVISEKYDVLTDERSKQWEELGDAHIEMLESFDAVYNKLAEVSESIENYIENTRQEAKRLANNIENEKKFTSQELNYFKSEISKSIENFRSELNSFVQKYHRSADVYEKSVALFQKIQQEDSRLLNKILSGR